MVTKLGKHEHANIMVPQDDFVRFENQPKINVEEMQNKINEFQDKKRQKIMFLKECLD